MGANLSEAVGDDRGRGLGKLRPLLYKANYFTHNFSFFLSYSFQTLLLILIYNSLHFVLEFLSASLDRQTFVGLPQKDTELCLRHIDLYVLEATR